MIRIHLARALVHCGIVWEIMALVSVSSSLFYFLINSDVENARTRCKCVYARLTATDDRLYYQFCERMNAERTVHFVKQTELPSTKSIKICD